MDRCDDTDMITLIYMQVGRVCPKSHKQALPVIL